MSLVNEGVLPPDELDDRDERREEQEIARSRETFADIVADLRKCAQIGTDSAERIKDKNLSDALKTQTEIYKTQTEIYSILADRLEAAARRAYNEIDRAVRETGRVNAEGVELIRTAMDETIGGYCE